MTRELLFATHNKNKTKEINQIIENFQILNLEDINFNQEIVENGKSFRENAEIKVDAIRPYYQGNIFADDSGLVIPALNGSPGIYSSRYAGTGNSVDNIEKVLKELEFSSDRSAYFVAVICLWLDGEKYFFEGRVEGEILPSPKGEGGFGYDPIFLPKGHHQSFALLSSEAKNSISHRGKAVQAMLFEQI
jgi:XTP/dITP diphosphohydrolase